MPSKSGKVPSYCLHKPSGRAVVYIDRKAVYLGPFGSEESHRNYEHEIARWRFAQDSGVPRESLAIETIAPKTVSELILAYLRTPRITTSTRRASKPKSLVK